MAFKRPPPPGFEPRWNDLRQRSEGLRRELTQLLDDCDRFLRWCRLASLTHKEAVAEFLEQRSPRVFGSREIQKALETEGMAFSNLYTVSAMLTRLQNDGRVVQVSHGKWAARTGVGSDRNPCPEAEADTDAEGRLEARSSPNPAKTD